MLPASRLTAWRGLTSFRNLGVRRLYSRTASVCFFSSALSGTATLISVPSSRLFGLSFFFRSRCLGGGLGARSWTPFAFATSKRLPSGEQRTDDGYQPAAM